MRSRDVGMRRRLGVFGSKSGRTYITMRSKVDDESREVDMRDVAIPPK
jgi:hypothetical protein